MDIDRLKARIADYLDAELGDEEIARRYPGAMRSTAGFNPRSVRTVLVDRSGPVESGFVRYAYRPFDTRWLYWEADSGLLDRPRPNFKPQVFEGSVWLSSAQHLRKGATEAQAVCTENLGSLHLIERGTTMIPPGSATPALEPMKTGVQRVPNLSSAAQRYLERLGMDVEDLFYHALAVLHDPAYRAANAGALRMEWPRIPLPGWPGLANYRTVCEYSRHGYFYCRISIRHSRKSGNPSAC